MSYFRPSRTVLNIDALQTQLTEIQTFMNTVQPLIDQVNDLGDLNTTNVFALQGAAIDQNYDIDTLQSDFVAYKASPGSIVKSYSQLTTTADTHVDFSKFYTPFVITRKRYDTELYVICTFQVDCSSGVQGDYRFRLSHINNAGTYNASSDYHYVSHSGSVRRYPMTLTWTTSNIAGGTSLVSGVVLNVINTLTGGTVLIYNLEYNVFERIP